MRDSSHVAGAGLRPGTVVIALDGVAISDAVEARMGRSYDHAVAAARDWALRSVLAGRHRSRRLLEIHDGGANRTVELPPADQLPRARAPLEAFEIRPGIGYIRFNDSLGDSDAVVAFDRAIDNLRQTRRLIIDLRNTPGAAMPAWLKGFPVDSLNGNEPTRSTCCPRTHATPRGPELVRIRFAPW